MSHMVRYTLKILQNMLQDFKGASGHFGTLCIKELKDQKIKVYLSFLKKP